MFSKIKIGQSFYHEGQQYMRINTEHKPRYGFVNAIGPATYLGDTGHRFFYDDQEAEAIS